MTTAFENIPTAQKQPTNPAKGLGFLGVSMTDRSTHWVILASAGVSGSVLFIYLMTPSKSQKLETLTVVPPITLFHHLCTQEGVSLVLLSHLHFDFSVV